jgi:hypothetical protein
MNAVPDAIGVGGRHQFIQTFACARLVFGCEKMGMRQPPEDNDYSSGYLAQKNARPWL